MQSTFILYLALLSYAALGQNSSPEKTCDLFLQSISVEKGELVDWELLSSLCTKDAQFRLARQDTLITLDFETFREQSRYSEIGFKESASNRKVELFGSIASIWEEFQAEVLSNGTQFSGMNMYHLIEVKGMWKLTEVIYQVAGPDLPLPSEK